MLLTLAERTGVAGGIERQRARLAAAETEVFAHYGVSADIPVAQCLASYLVVAERAT